MKESLNIIKKTQYGSDVVSITGDISRENVSDLAVFLLKNPLTQGGNVIFDLSGVKHINSFALSDLEKIFQDIAAKKIHIFIMNMEHELMNLFSTSRIRRYYRIVENETMLSDRMKKRDFEDLLDPDSE